MIEAYAGIPVQLAVTATDGATDLNLRATIFNGNASPVPVGAVNLVHKLIGFYRAEILLAPGVYRAVYRNFTDAERTILDPWREHDQDDIIVRPLDVPLIGVAYDSATKRLLFEVTMSRQGQPMDASELTSCAIDVYDGDDNLMLTTGDLAPDSQGVFRAHYDDPPLAADRLYYTYVTVETTAGTVTANKGFHTTE